jgi:uncharacterized protein YqgV (UPF0045/DUF77 family)
VLRVEFTVEPFVEGHPGPHVMAAVDAVRALHLEVEIGPFGSSFEADPQVVGPAVGALVAAAHAHGASHVSLHTERIEPRPSDRTPGS